MKNTTNQPTRFAGVSTPLERARDVNFSKRLKAILADKEMTASDVAAKIWDRYTNSKGARVAKGRDRLSVWLSGKSFPDPENLRKLAHALNVPISELSPDAELKTASRATPKGTLVWSDDYPEGQTFLQLAQYVPMDVAMEILTILKRVNERANKKPEREG